MNALGAFAVGLLFGIGLIVSGMSDPARVLGFLDLAGAWDPSLALVMAGALLPASLAYRFARQRKVALLGESMCLPAVGGIDQRLLAGSALFGIGWGLAGICPGPALVLAGTGSVQGMVFLGALVAGILLFEAPARKD
ncbi:MAG: hypothetical protein KA603_00370 [Azonexus sp.]|nr:hypothetical protein [Betaproteobacteria bacterium]MBK8918641.1 hypothetical protein [Betaproteobacteria bacterium]MBP6034574.1 hypothetical protein [Azonexus sp.]MBP6905114.1 hypothetical protein [Azonexus sp.]